VLPDPRCACVGVLPDQDQLRFFQAMLAMGLEDRGSWRGGVHSAVADLLAASEVTWRRSIEGTAAAARVGCNATMCVTGHGVRKAVGPLKACCVMYRRVESS
jgi:hypothetical protein